MVNITSSPILERGTQKGNNEYYVGGNCNKKSHLLTP